MKILYAFMFCSMRAAYAVSSVLIYSPCQFQSEISNKNVLWDCVTISGNGPWGCPSQNCHLNMGLILNGFGALGTGNVKKISG
jgi:hypothetical protein